MHRQIDEQVLRLHPHSPVFGRRQREVNAPAGNVAAHRRRIVERELKEGEDALHASLLDLAARPELVQDRARLGIQADMPGPARLVDLADRLYPNLEGEEM